MKKIGDVVKFKQYYRAPEEEDLVVYYIYEEITSIIEMGGSLRYSTKTGKILNEELIVEEEGEE